LGETPTLKLLEDGKVALTPGHLFGPECTQFIRLNFATSQQIISEG